MNNLISKTGEIPLCLPSGGHEVRIKRCARICSPQGSKKDILVGVMPLSVAARVLVLVFSLVVGGVSAVGVNPNLAESVTELVHKEHIDAAAEEQHRRTEILWLARIIYSETEAEPEMAYIGWAARNRVVASVFPNTYQEIALQPHQFSGLNDYDQWYDINISRDYGLGDHVWDRALKVAEEVYDAPDSERLLPHDAMHFYSPVATDAPEWAWGKTPVETLYGRRGVRFAFYSGVQ